jgi:hypothetical protein
MKFDLKTILTLSFSAGVFALTFMGKIEPNVAIVPVFLSIMAYYFAKKDESTPST